MVPTNLKMGTLVLAIVTGRGRIDSSRGMVRVWFAKELELQLRVAGASDGWYVDAPFVAAARSLRSGRGGAEFVGSGHGAGARAHCGGLGVMHVRGDILGKRCLQGRVANSRENQISIS